MSTPLVTYSPPADNPRDEYRVNTEDPTLVESLPSVVPSPNLDDVPCPNLDLPSASLNTVDYYLPHSLGLSCSIVLLVPWQ